MARQVADFARDLHVDVITVIKKNVNEKVLQPARVRPPSHVTKTTAFLKSTNFHFHKNKRNDLSDHAYYEQ